MFILNGAGEILFFNKSALRLQPLLGRPLQRGIRFADVVSNDRKELVNAIITNVMQDKTSQTSEAEYKDATGRSVYFEVTYHPILNETNDASQICVVSREITHEKTFERKTAELVNELSNLIEYANAMIFSVDSREYLTEWNRECVNTTQYEKNDVLARKVDIIVDNGYTEKVKNILSKVLKGEAISNQELGIRKKDGSIVKVLANATPKVNSSKNVIGVLFVGQDITELSNYRQSLEEKVKDRTEKLKQALEKEKEFVDLKNRFVSVASHEFKIPLSSITSAVQAIRSHGDLTAPDLEKLNSIEKQAGYMKGLLDDILSLKKGETGLLKPNYSNINLTEFLRKLIDEVLDSTQHTHFITTEFFPEVIEVEADEKLLRNIFVNILSNAIKFSPEAKQVDLTVSTNDTHATVRVTDHGIGIDQKDLARVFEPFNRGSNVSNIKGTGLGLSIVKKAIETMDGNLTVSSELGKGTTMIVQLKLKH
jgi:PAS domain S-box-containing protein